MSGKGFTRRSVAIGGSIAAVLGIAALGITLPKLIGRRYRESPYDDLFAQLTDRDAAVKLGRAMLDGGLHIDAKTVGRDLRQRFERRNLGEVTDSDLAQSKLMEAQGWVLPESLALLCALAAEES